jgi:RNA polymerase sigma factor (sigma-70 family)
MEIKKIKLTFSEPITPLVLLEDRDLLERVKGTMCEGSMKLLIKRHTPLCLKVMKRYTPAMLITGVYDRNMYKELNVLIYKAMMSFNPDKGVKFSTWLGNQARYFCLNILNRKKKLILLDEDSLDMIASSNEQKNNRSTKDITEYIFNILDQMKDYRISKVFNFRYFSSDKKDSSWEIVAKKIGVSTQTAINLHNKGKRVLKKKLLSSDLNYLDKI